MAYHAKALGVFQEIKTSKEKVKSKTHKKIKKRRVLKLE